MWPWNSIVVQLVFWTIFGDIVVSDCNWDQVKIDFAVCKAVEPNNGYGVTDLIYPTRDCYYYSPWVEYVSFTTSLGRDVDLETGDQIELHCEAKSRHEGYAFTMWLCQRSSETLDLCLCPQTAARSKGTRYPLRYISSTSQSKLNLNYTLTNVNVNSSDQFYCLVQVSYGRHIYGFADININVKETRKPEITRGPLNTTVIPGEESILSCKATGFPDVSYLWFKDGELLNEENSTRYAIITETSASKLFFNVTSPEDEGIYTCHAVNSAGSATSEGALLNVETSMKPSAKSVVIPDSRLPLGIGGAAAAFALLAISIVIVVYRNVIKKQLDRLREQGDPTKPVSVTIDRELDVNNFVVNVDGQGRDVTCNFMGNVNVGGANLADQIEAIRDDDENVGIPYHDDPGDAFDIPRDDDMEQGADIPYDDDLLDEEELDMRSDDDGQNQAERQEEGRDYDGENLDALFDLSDDDINDAAERRPEPEQDGDDNVGWEDVW